MYERERSALATFRVRRISGYLECSPRPLLLPPNGPPPRYNHERTLRFEWTSSQLADGEVEDTHEHSRGGLIASVLGNKEENGEVENEREQRRLIADFTHTPRIVSYRL